MAVLSNPPDCFTFQAELAKRGEGYPEQPQRAEVDQPGTDLSSSQEETFSSERRLGVGWGDVVSALCPVRPQKAGRVIGFGIIRLRFTSSCCHLRSVGCWEGQFPLLQNGRKSNGASVTLNAFLFAEGTQASLEPAQYPIFQKKKARRKELEVLGQSYQELLFMGHLLCARRFPTCSGSPLIFQPLHWLFLL